MLMVFLSFSALPPAEIIAFCGNYITLNASLFWKFSAELFKLILYIGIHCSFEACNITAFTFQIIPLYEIATEDFSIHIPGLL